MADLFSENFSSKTEQFKEVSNLNAPLAFRLRPKSLAEFIGQKHLLGEGKLLKRTIQADRLASLIFYGPSGTGKTSLAHLISLHTHAAFKSLNAVTANLQDLRRILEEAKQRRAISPAIRTILFIDEIHRFNKAQQDALMPDVENGTVVLIGSTTHNPSFTVNGALLSRSLVCEFKPLEDDDIHQILIRALKDPVNGFGKMNVKMDEDALAHIVKSASGDARRALNTLEIGVLTTAPDPSEVIHFTAKAAEESSQRKVVYYDHDEDYHYDTASAFIKSMRGSDPDASVYWLAKMLYAGEDPRFIARRIVILASEDIGNADPQALILASAGLNAIEFVGMPEARIILSQMVTYMALAPKSNAAYLAIENASSDLEKTSVEEVPNHLRDSHYKSAKKMGHGVGYQYPHDFPGAHVEQNYGAGQKRYYEPKKIGFEKILSDRLEELRKKRQN